MQWEGTKRKGSKNSAEEDIQRMLLSEEEQMFLNTRRSSIMEIQGIDGTLPHLHEISVSF